LWADFVDASDEEGDAEWATHHRILIVYTLAKTECEVADGLRDALHLDPLVVGECMVLGGYAGVVDYGARVGSEARHGAPEMRVDLHDFFY